MIFSVAGEHVFSAKLYTMAFDLHRLQIRINTWSGQISLLSKQRH